MRNLFLPSIDTPGVIDRVSSLFRAHPNLIHGFNTFLPPGYSLEPTNNPADPVRVSTPRDRPYPHHAAHVSEAKVGGYYGAREEPQYTPSLPPISSLGSGAPHYTPQMAGASNIINSMNPPPASSAPAPRSESIRPRAPVEFNHAISYVNKIKNRYASEPETYKQFLEILQAYQKEQKPIQEVYTQVQILFKGAPDLLDEFKQFLPDTSAPSASAQTVPSVPKPAPQTKKQPKRSVPSNPPVLYNAPPVAQSLPPPKKKARVAKPEKPGTMEELEFFDKCKRVIGNKTTYNEFLKVLNLFSQEIIEAKVLIERVEPFLGKAPELFDWFKRFVKYEDDDVICSNF